jgi:PAS domain S-box-containing protein
MADECTEDKTFKKLVAIILQALGIRSVVSIPLVSDGKGIGLMDISRHEPFTESDMRWLQTISGQLVNVIKRKQAEEKLGALSHHQETILAAVPDIIMEVDSNKIYTWANQAGIDFFGEDVIGKEASFYFLCEQHTYTDVQPIFDGSGETLYVESLQRRKDGEKRLLAWWCRTLKDTHGNVIGALSAARDITELKLAEEELKKTEQKYRQLAASISDVFFAMDEELRYTYWNKASEELTGITAKDALGRSLTEVFPDNWATRTVRAMYLRAMETQQPQHFTVDYPGGENVIHEISAYPTVGGVSVFVKDVTERKQAEQKLRESEQKFRLLSDNVTDIVWTMDVKTQKFNYLSPSVERTLGYTPAELMEIPLNKALTPDSYEQGMKALAEELERDNTPDIDPDRIRTLQLEEFRKDGSISPMEVRIKFLRDANGLPTHVIGITRDITERKQSEEALKVSEERFRRLAENAQDIIFRYRQLPSLGFDYISPAVLRISGYMPEEFYADPLLIFKIVHPDSRSFLQEITSRPQDYLERPVVLHWVHKNGESIWTEQRSVPIYDDDGKIVAVEGIQRDMTERKRIEENLRESEANLRAYLDNAPDGVCIYDLQGTFLYGNKRAEEIMGYRKEELIGKSFLSLEILPTKYLAKAGELLTLNAGGKSTGPDEFELTTKDGNHSWVEISTTPIKQSDKVLILSFIRDINDRKRADVALRISEENYRNSVANSPMGIIVFKREGDIIYANQTLLDMYGFSDIEELRNTPVKERYTPEAYAEYLVRHEEFLNGKKGPMDYEISIRPKDGAVRQLQAFRREVVWGEEEQFQLLYIDITERKKAEEAMRESRARFRELSMLLPQSVWETDENGMVTYTNEATMRLFGYTRQDTVPLHYLQNMIPEDRDRAAENTQRLLQGENLGGIEYTGLRKDGSTFPEMIYASAIIRNGKRVGLRGITVDITEQKKSEKRLEQAAREWRVTFDSLTDVVAIVDVDYKIMRVNMAYANALKMEPQQLLGKKCYELLNRDCPHTDCPHQQTLKTGKPARAEYFEPFLGTYIEVSTSPMYNENGDVKGTVHITRDISERKQMEQQLMLTDRLASVGELASGVAHELNNPLTSVIGFSQLLMEGEIPTAIKEDLGLINSEAQRAASIVKNLLTFARKHAAVKQPTKINNLIEDVLKLRAYEQKVNNIEVIKNLASDIPEIMLDYFQVQQVFLNIIINAEFFMTEAHRRGLLTITTEKIGRMVRVSFVDDGPGIPQENLNRIFDPFFTTKEVGKGTGLGLSICHGIITEHSGTIHAESPGGKGAAFIIELPLSDLDV